MFELLMLLIIPSEIEPTKFGIKYLLKERFVDYQSCEKYVDKYVITKEDKNGIYYTLNTKEYKVMLTYCKEVDNKNVEKGE